jgi:glycosyltransferase involved in cell wall biosynthesis
MKTNVNGEPVTRLRVLILAPSCDPEGISVPFVGYSHAAALAGVHDVTLVVGAPSENSVRRANAPFRSIEVVRMPRLDRIQAWIFRNIFRSNFDSQAVTASGYPFSLAFEWFAWRQLKRRIYQGEYDIVLRILPVTVVLPSAFAFFLRNGPIPLVIGPLNGGLPWPPGFSQLEKQKEWVSSLRNLYRYLPFAKSTYRYAAAIIAASSQTCGEFARYRDKLFFIPENGISRSLCSDDLRSKDPESRLDLIFVGGLVPRKACDLALRAAAPLLRGGRARFTVLGDGPERKNLEQLVKSLGIDKDVVFFGWVARSKVIQRLRSADVLVFPSVRDFGGGVVFEALATGAVPVVADFGGPGDIVKPEVGCKVPVTSEADLLAQMERVLTELADDRDLLEELRLRGMSYAREYLTWEAKAQDTSGILRWVLGIGPKPDLVPPTRSAAAVATLCRQPEAGVRPVLTGTRDIGENPR